MKLQITVFEPPDNCGICPFSDLENYTCELDEKLKNVQRYAMTGIRPNGCTLDATRRFLVEHDRIEGSVKVRKL
jgi:hypothetical protein